MRFPGYNRYSFKRSHRNSLNPSPRAGRRDVRSPQNAWKRDSVPFFTNQKIDVNQENQNPLQVEDIYRAKSFNHNRSLRPRSLLRPYNYAPRALSNTQSDQQDAPLHVNELPTPPASPEHDSGTFGKVTEYIAREDKEEDSDKNLNSRSKLARPRARMIAPVAGKRLFGEFHCNGRFSLPHPGLRVPGLREPVAFPLPGWQTEQLAAIALRNLHDQDRGFAIDRAVQGFVELDASAVTFDNPEWSTAMTSLAQRAVSQLGIQMQVRAVLQKLIVNTKGAYSKSFRIPPKEKGDAGTMIVQLPSMFKGGELSVKFQGVEKVHTVGSEDRSCEYSSFYTGWLAEAEGEIRPIAKGVRLLFLYNLTGTSTDEPITTERASQTLL